MRTRLTLLFALIPLIVAAQDLRLKYPVTRTVDTVDTYGTVKVPDPYRWLEAIDSKEVADWVKTENAISAPDLAALPGRDALRARITGLYNYPRTGIPFWEGTRWWYSRNLGLQKQNVWYSRSTLDGAEQLVLDPNTLSPDGSISLSDFSPAPDGKHLAYGQSEGGSDWMTVYVRDLSANKNTADVVRWVKFSHPGWTRDGRGFFYSRYPEPEKGKELEVKLEGQALYYHRLESPQTSDIKIYDRPDNPTWFVFGAPDESGRYLFVVTSKGTDKNELYVADMGDRMHPNVQAAIKPIVTGHDANYLPLGVVNGRLIMQADKNAPNRMIVGVPLSTPAPENWKKVIPEGTTPIEAASLVAGQIAIQRLEDVTSALRLYSLDGKTSNDVKLPGLGSVTAASNALEQPSFGRFDRPEVMYAFTSPLQPTTAYVYDTKSDAARAFNPPRLTFDPTRFVTERVFFTSKDGTRVPMFLTHRKDLQKNGQNPTMLYAYGGFSISSLPTFSPVVISWVEQGGIYALANIRGGGEYGEKWHQAAQFEKKQNVFDDFIAAAEYLAREKYTSASHLAINGGSNGGLLVGVVMTQRPELFAAAIPQVGVMDMLRYDKFTGGAAWATEYGSPSDPSAFRYLRAYSPLHNIKPNVCYPATLITTADHDDRVVPSHSFKFAAALQAAQAGASGCTNPILIRVETQGSHGYRPLDKRIEELADIWAFAAKHTGMTPR